MIFHGTKLRGSYIIELEKREDSRGFFARTWCQDEFKAYGLNANWVQSNLSYNAKRGTLRGMHYQAAPYQEAKLVRCARGAIYDVIIDLTQDSLTYRQWLGVELSGGNYRSLYVPEGFAHGFLTLEDDTEVVYQVSQFYQPESERGVRYNDPAFGIQWPIDIAVISEKDMRWPDYAGS
ncbi:MAG TPA: dTDP-4-dehydrorhamnose 3,5-epimerase [Candidatus Binatia bacterium]|nr:dTDP-4-dehydrorhamnose 3,5-epimerase [Candidatus Binatia bacterium]